MATDIVLPQGVTGISAGVAGSLEFSLQRIKQAIDGLTQQQLESVPPGLANSIATLVVHIAGTEVSMAHGLRGEATPEAIQAEYLLDQPYSPLPKVTGETVATLIAKLDRARAVLIESLAQPMDFNREIQMRSGRTVTVRWVLSLLPSHAALHLGHIQMIRRLLSA